MPETIEGTIRFLNSSFVKRFCKEEIKLSSEHTPSDLSRMEEYIMRNMSSEKKQRPELVTILGVYLGEIVIKNIGGKWNTKVNNILEVSVDEIGNYRLSILPFMRILNFAQSRESIIGLYNLCKDISNGEIDVSNLQSDEWHDIGKDRRLKIIDME